MKTYYQVLELSEQATAAEIRQAYLRWVRLTHPDRTPDPAAHARYLLVNEAYDTLSKPESRARYDARLRGGNAMPATQPAAVPTVPFPGNAYQVLRVPYSATAPQIEQAYRRIRQALLAVPADPALRAHLAQVEHAYATLVIPWLRQLHDARVRGRKPDRPPSLYAELYQRYSGIGRATCWTLLVFFGLILVDRSWTLTFSSEQPLSVREYRGRGDYHWVTTPHAAFRVVGTFPAGTYFAIERSAVLQQVRRYQYWRGAKPASGVINYDSGSVYGALFFFPVAMAGCAAFGLWRRRSPKRTVDSAVSGVLLAVVVVYLFMAL
ncbi:J domain-containing protein [Hymenobacter koreensis]|uniref:J domain-containing protein n=1 Tax=Hymenobacter koreensis TaxID=1084523 RepID=A0ABP8IZR4_9BACT